MDGKRVVLDAYINVIFVDARNFDLQGDVVLVFVYIHRRRRFPRVHRGSRPPGRRRPARQGAVLMSMSRPSRGPGVSTML